MEAFSKFLPLLLLLILFLHDTINLGFCHADTFPVVCSKLERDALLDFKKHLADPSGRLTSWVGEDCCRWEGISCNNETKHVTGIELRSPVPDNLDDETWVELEGDISPSLVDLKELDHLDLSANNFRNVRIPRFIGSLYKLRYLNLSGGSFVGAIPSSFGNLSNLVYLDLNGNILDSDLTWLASLYSLKYLNLGDADLSKAAGYWVQVVNMLPSLLELHFSTCQLSNLPLVLPVVNFTNLSVLDLSSNGFNSTVPNWFFELRSLTWLDLNSNNLRGELSEGFANLNSLKHLDLSSNSYIQGAIPKGLGELCGLKRLKLSFNKISGEITSFIDSLSECIISSLEELDLDYNALTGTLPRSLGSLKNLRYLQLRMNSFHGMIPTSIEELTVLEELYLSDNQMSGIPENLGQLSSLVVLDLSENAWEGVLTEAHFRNLSSLKELSLYKTSPNISFSLETSSVWIPPFRLKYINIRSCNLGPKFPSWLRNQEKLNTLVLNNARISDTIPDWFWKLNLRVDELDVAYNQLRGRIPNTLDFNYPSTVDLSSNQFSGSLPLWSSNVTKLYLRDNRFSAIIPRNIGKVMPSLTDLDISYNHLNGSIPTSIGNLQELIQLFISNNNLSGEIPRFWNNTPSLFILDMSYNQLSGTLPISLGYLNSLILLILSNNDLSGEITSSLRNCTKLDSLDLGYNHLSGGIPRWIGESFQELLILRLRFNRLTGNIPNQVCKLRSLHILDLSNNQLSGKIPSCIGNLSGFSSKVSDMNGARYQGKLSLMSKGSLLEYQSTLYLVNSLDLSINDLSGELPDELTRLAELGTLNLSVNHFTGLIPSHIGNLLKLETLDLSRNQLYGQIPTSMAFQTFLNHLNLSHNNLFGKIPTANQFQTFIDPLIYSGNAGLCGLPLPNKCADTPSDHVPNNNTEDDDGDVDNDEFDKLFFFISMLLGFFFGFWGLCGTLIVKTSWRVAVFSFVDEAKDRFVVFIRLFRRI